jgi:hypothetical protein
MTCMVGLKVRYNNDQVEDDMFKVELASHSTLHGWSNLARQIGGGIQHGLNDQTKFDMLKVKSNMIP